RVAVSGCRKLSSGEGAPPPAIWRVFADLEAHGHAGSGDPGSQNLAHLVRIRRILYRAAEQHGVAVEDIEDVERRLKLTRADRERLVRTEVGLAERREPRVTDWVEQHLHGTGAIRARRNVDSRTRRIALANVLRRRKTDVLPPQTIAALNARN